jgi:hypothetical protein
MIIALKTTILAAILLAMPDAMQCAEWNTSRDVIAAKATARYKLAIEKCSARRIELHLRQ